MSLTILGQAISSVAVVDDDPGARDSYSYSIEDLGIGPLPYSPPDSEAPITLDRCLRYVMAQSKALLCDHHLRKHNYAQFNGAELVARCYEKSFPAILCTKYEHAEVVEIRSHRKFIPVLLNPNDVTPERLREGWERCLREFRGEFRQDRRPWRTQVRFDGVEIERGTCLVILPGWSSTEGLSLRLDDLPPGLAERVRMLATVSGLPLRVHAEVNVGTERPEELYFQSWEY